MPAVVLSAPRNPGRSNLAIFVRSRAMAHFSSGPRPRGASPVRHQASAAAPRTPPSRSACCRSSSRCWRFFLPSSHVSISRAPTGSGEGGILCEPVCPPRPLPVSQASKMASHCRLTSHICGALYPHDDSDQNAANAVDSLDSLYTGMSARYPCEKCGGLDHNDSVF